MVAAPPSNTRSPIIFVPKAAPPTSTPSGVTSRAVLVGTVRAQVTPSGRSNRAATDRSPSMTTVQVPCPEQAPPDQPENTEGGAGRAMSVTV